MSRPVAPVNGRLFAALAAPGAALAVVVLVAAAARLSRWPFRWNQITLAYATYFSGWWTAFQAGEWWTCLTTFVGVHPPLYSLVFSLVQAADARPAAWMLTSAAFSVAAVPAAYALARVALGTAGSLAAAAALALSAHQALYSLEVNDYPLLVLLGTLSHLAFSRVFLSGSGRGAAVYGVVTLAALYTHFLAVTLLAAQGLALLLWHRPRLPRFLAAVAGVSLLALPMIPAVLANAGGEGYINAPTAIGEVARTAAGGLWRGFGPSWIHVPLLSLTALGAARALADRRGALRYLLLFLAVSGAFLAALLAAGVAAPHQFPYYLHLGPAVLVLAGAGFESLLERARARPLALRLMPALFLLVPLAARAAWFAGTAGEARALRAAARTSHPSVAALAQEWKAGEAAFLLAPPSFGDDVKDRVDPAWALLSPFVPHRFHRPSGVPQFEPPDPYWGNPFEVGGRYLYTFTGVDGERWRPIVQGHLADGQPVWIAAYDLRAAPGLRYEVEAVLDGYAADRQRDFGVDGALWRVTGAGGVDEPSGQARGPGPEGGSPP